MGETRISAFGDDALADLDAVGTAALIRSGAVSADEVAAAAVARVRLVDPTLNAVVHEAFDRPRRSADTGAALYGVPTFVKDNTDVGGMPSNHGTFAYVARPAQKDGRYTRQYLSTGMTVLGKSRLPEFGFNASTEFMDAAPTRNPWNTAYSVGASSGGAAALVASGAVPIAHANDGGGSIRIPAAAAGLVGLKPSRGRHIAGEETRMLPIDIISEGVLTRTVRDTAAFLAAAEDHWRRRGCRSASSCRRRTATSGRWSRSRSRWRSSRRFRGSRTEAGGGHGRPTGCPAAPAARGVLVWSHGDPPPGARTGRERPAGQGPARPARGHAARPADPAGEGVHRAVRPGRAYGD